MPRGYKKNYKKSVAAKASRGGSSKQKTGSGKQSKQQRSRRRRFSPKGGQRNIPARVIKNEWTFEIEDKPATSSKMPMELPVPLKLSSSRKMYGICDVEYNIDPSCNNACCKPIVIGGLQKLLLEGEMPQQLEQPEKQQQQLVLSNQPSYNDIAELPPPEVQYYFEDMHKVSLWRLFQDDDQHDQYSVGISFDSRGIAKYQPVSYRGMSAFQRYHSGGCDTCSHDARSSYGFNADYQDKELLVLPNLEFSVSSKLYYQPFRLQLQKKITEVYDWKYEMHNLDDSNQEDSFLLKQLNTKCKKTTKSIESLLKAYIFDEISAHSELSLLSLGVYKCHLQQLAIGSRHGKEHLDRFLAGESGSLYEYYSGWENLKATVPHKSLSTIGVIVEHVKPFLLDLRPESYGGYIWW